MRHISLLAVSLLALAACTPEKQQEADDYTQYVNPFIGTDFTTRVRDKDCVKNRVKRAKIVRFTLC